MENKKDRIKGAASFMPHFEPMESLDRIANKEDLLDHNWLFNNIPWGNHSNKNAKVILPEVTTLHYFVKDGYDTKGGEFRVTDFDNLIVDCVHGFAGNSYSFRFRVGEEDKCVLYETKYFGYDKEVVRKSVIDSLSREIKGLEKQITYNEDAIKIIEKL